MSDPSIEPSVVRSPNASGSKGYPNDYYINKQSVPSTVSLTLGGGSPAARRLLGLQVLKEEVRAKKKADTVDLLRLNPTHAGKATISKHSTRAHELRQAKQTGHLRKVRSPTENVSDEAVSVRGNSPKATEEIGNLKTVLALAASWEAVCKGIPVNLGYIERLKQDANQMRGNDALSPKKVIGATPSTPEEGIGKGLLKCLAEIIPSNEAHQELTTHHDEAKKSQLAHAVMSSNQLISSMQIQITKAADRWEQLAGRPAISTSSTSVSVPNNPNVTVLLDTNMAALRARQPISTSLTLGSSPQRRAIHTLFQESMDSKELAAIEEVASDLQGMVAAQALLKQGINEVTSAAEAVLEENQSLRRMAMMALSHITKMQVTQNALEAERVVVLDALSDFNESCRKQTEASQAISNAALGVLDDGASRLKHYLSSNTNPSDSQPNMIAVLHESFSEVRDKIAKIQADASEAYEMEVLGVLADKLRRGTIDSIALADEVKRLHEAEAQLLLDQCDGDLKSAIEAAEAACKESAGDHTIQLQLLKEKERERQAADEALTTLLSSKIPTLVLAQNTPSVAKVLAMEIRGGSPTKRGVSPNATPKVHHPTPSSSSKDNNNDAIITNAVVTALRSQLATHKSAVAALTTQLADARARETSQNIAVKLVKADAQREIDRLRKERDSLLQERSLFVDAVLLSHQQTATGAFRDLHNSRPNYGSQQDLLPRLDLPKYTSRQLMVISAALTAIKDLGNTKQAIRLACYSQWKFFVSSRRATKIQQDLEDLNFCASVSPDSQQIFANFRKQHNQIRKRERGEQVGVIADMEERVANPVHISLSSLAKPSNTPNPSEASPNINRPHHHATQAIDWSREYEMADLVSRISTQQATLMTLTSERDDLLLQNTLLKRRLVALGGGGSQARQPDRSEDTNIVSGTHSANQSVGTFPIMTPVQLQTLIEENKPMLINPNLRKEKKKTLLGERDASLAAVAMEPKSDAHGSLAEPSAANMVIPQNSITAKRAQTPTTATKQLLDSEHPPMEEKDDEEESRKEKTGLGGRKAVQQVILRNPLGAGAVAAKAITEATNKMRSMDHKNGEDDKIQQKLTEGHDALVVAASRKKETQNESINTNSAWSRSLAAAMPGSENSPKQLQRVFAIGVGGSTVSQNSEDQHDGGSPARNPVSQIDFNSPEESFAKALAEKILPLVNARNSKKSDTAALAVCRPGSSSSHSQSTGEVKRRIRKIANTSKEESDLQKVADEVERNLAATAVGGTGDGRAEVTLDAVQMNALRAYAILHPILQGVLRRLKVVSLNIEPLPLYEATTQPIIAIVLSWVERNFSRLLHVLTCEDRLLRVKWRMTFLSIRLRSRIAATEADIRYGRTDQRTMQLLKLQLSEYWLILKGATSCRQHSEALRKGQQKAHLGSTPEKQAQLQREMLQTITSLEDEAESYVRRTSNNTFRARQQQLAGFDAAIFGDSNPAFAAESKLHEDRKRQLLESVEAEAVKRNARSPWASVVLAQPSELSSPINTTSSSIEGTKSKQPSLIVVNSEASRLLRSQLKGSNIASGSKVNRILEGLNKDMTIHNNRTQKELLEAKTKALPLLPRAQTPQEYHQPTTHQPTGSQSITSLVTSHTNLLQSNKEVLDNLRQLHASAVGVERIVGGKGVVGSPSRHSSDPASQMYGCELGPVVGPQSKGLVPIIRPVLSGPKPTTTMLFSTDDNHSSTDPRYVDRIVKQYDTYVLSNCVPTHIDKSGAPPPGSPFEVFNSVRGRAVAESESLPTLTPTESVTKRLL